MARKLEYQTLQLVGKNWGKASQTIGKNKGNMRRIARMLEKKFGLEQIQNLKTKHVRVIFDDLIGSGLDPSTLSGYATAFRMIAHAIGKKNIVPRTNRELGFSRRGMRFRPVEANIAFLQSVRKELYNRA